LMFFFFFSSRRRHTRWPRDWSSDVCSSDLIPELGWSFGYWWSWAWIVLTTILQLAFFRWLGWIGGDPIRRPELPPLRTLDPRSQIGRASCRERVLVSECDGGLKKR